MLAERGWLVKVLTSTVEGRLGVVRSAVSAGRRTGRPPLSVNKCALYARIRVVPRSFYDLRPKIGTEIFCF